MNLKSKGVFDSIRSLSGIDSREFNESVKGLAEFVGTIDTAIAGKDITITKFYTGENKKASEELLNTITAVEDILKSKLRNTAEYMTEVYAILKKLAQTDVMSSVINAGILSDTEARKLTSFITANVVGETIADSASGLQILEFTRIAFAGLLNGVNTVTAGLLEAKAANNGEQLAMLDDVLNKSGIIPIEQKAKSMSFVKKTPASSSGSLFGGGGGSLQLTKEDLKPSSKLKNTSSSGSIFGDSPKSSGFNLSETKHQSMFGGGGGAFKGGLFGDSHRTSSAFSGKSFGGESPSLFGQPKSGGLFGATKESGGLFGNLKSETRKGLFGGDVEKPTGGIFGNIGKNSSGGSKGGIFGGKTTGTSPSFIY